MEGWRNNSKDRERVREEGRGWGGYNGERKKKRRGGEWMGEQGM